MRNFLEMQVHEDKVLRVSGRLPLGGWWVGTFGNVNEGAAKAKA